MKVKNITKYLLLTLTFAPIITLTSCGKGVRAYLDEVGIRMFADPNKNNDHLNIYFLDGDSVVSKDGKDFTRTSFGGDDSNIRNINSTESYIIKCGNTEMLVDCGYQLALGGSQQQPPYPYTMVDAGAYKNAHENILKKIASLCTDGVLEYLVVTHGDFDHLGSLVYNGCVFDSFFQEETITNFAGEKIQLKQIEHIIDFDTPIVALHSFDQINKEKRFVNSTSYQRYRILRDKLCKKKNNKSIHIPVSALFANGSKVDKLVLNEEHKVLACPFTNQEMSSRPRPLSELFPNEAAGLYVNSVYKNKDFAKKVQSLGGELKCENERFYYELPFGSAKLRFLYQWYYDYAINHAFESKARNNISVCFQVQKGSKKFAAFGDLSGDGERSIIKYYKDTSLLKNVDVFKASHHGSTHNKENSVELFRLLKPKLIPIVGCAQCKLEPAGYNSNAPVIDQQFLDNIYNALGDGDSKPIVLYTNIAHKYFYNDHTFLRSGPFYGDIHVCLRTDEVSYSNSYKGIITPYITKAFHVEYEKEHNDKSYTFKTRNSKEIKNVLDLDWIKKIGFTYGGKADEK